MSNTFEITIQRKAETGWPVVLELSGAKTPLVVRHEGVLELDLLALASQVTPRDYGTLLGRALFREDVRDAFLQARATSEDYLSVLLSVEDPELRTLRWERLCAPLDGRWDFLMLDQRAPLSLYLPSATDRRFPPIGRRDLRALVVIASPQGLERYQLSPFDIEATVSSVRSALGEIPCDVLATTKDAIGLPTLDVLCEYLTTTPYSLLHIVCHGRYVANSGETILYLANENNQVAPVDGTRLIERLARLRGARGLPHFVFLATCESASPQAESALGGLAQRLVRELGMPAVLAMTERVSIATAQTLASNFYRRLQAHGKVDVALGEACAGLAERSDITVPALYSRLGTHPLFSDTLDRDLTPNEIQFGIRRMGNLLVERAPILRQRLAAQATILDTRVGKTAALSKDALGDRELALDEINRGCEEALDLSFHALCLGKDPPSYDSRCPFRGLYAFRPEDHEFFFGREALIERLQQRLSHHPFLAMLGPSGSGKSSLVLAGLVPALQQHEPGSQLIIITPGSEPLSQLEASLAKVTSPYVLVVDQFEEVFTLCSSEEQRRAFFAKLIELVRRQQRVIITMRADFWGECAPYREFKALMQAHQELVSPMDTAELRRAIEQQAAAVRLRFEADLSSTLLEDVECEPAAMPLLQHALLELWRRRHGRWLRTEEYRAIGGVQKAIAQTADAVYEDKERTPAERERMREIFVRLTRPDLDAGTGEERRDTRQRVWLEELVPAESDPEATKKLVKLLADKRLVVTSVNSVTGREEVEVAHEALIRHWPRLRSWLDEERVRLRLREGIREAAREWELGNHDEGLLVHRGSRLQESEALAKQPGYALNKLERTYLDACVEKRTRSDRQRRRRNMLLGTISVLLALAIIGALGLLVVYQRQQLDSLPATVTTTNDSGPDSLREAIQNAHDGDAITFAKTLTEPNGQQCTRCTITLTSGELKITQNLTISGPGVQLLTISGGHRSRVFEINPNITVTLSNLAIDSGLAKSNAQVLGEGGGILCNDSCTLTMMNSVVSHNIANNGGGIENADGTITLVNSTISGNMANNRGGGIDNPGSLTLSKSTISGNIAHGEGGGIRSVAQLDNSPLDNDLTITNSTLSGNQAHEGGGIYTVTSYMFIYFSTIYDNTATKSGGVSISGIGSNGQSVRASEIDTSIIANNHAPPPNTDIAGTITIKYSPDWIQDPSGATFLDASGNTPIDPHKSTLILSGPLLLGALGHNGGLTATYALNPGSPAIGKIPAQECSPDGIDITIDQRNMPRPRTQGANCDLGAYEFS